MRIFGQVFGVVECNKAIFFLVVFSIVFVELTHRNNDNINVTAAVTNEEKEKAIYSTGFMVTMNRFTLGLGERGSVICQADDALKKVKFNCSVESDTVPQCENIQNAILECIGVLSNARNVLEAQRLLKNFRSHRFLSLLNKFQMQRQTLELEFDWTAITENITNSIKAKKMSGFWKGAPTFNVSNHKLAGMEKCCNDIARNISEAGHTISGLLEIKHNGTAKGFPIKITLKDFSAALLKLDVKVLCLAGFKDFKTCYSFDSMKNMLIDLDYNGEKTGVSNNKVGAGSSKKDAPVDGNERGASGGKQKQQPSQQTQTQGSSTTNTSRQGLGAGFGQSQNGGDGEEPWRPPDWKPQECPDNEVPESDKKQRYKRKSGQSEIEQGASKMPKYLENVTGTSHNGTALQATSDTYQNMAGANDPSRNSEQLSGQPGNILNSIILDASSNCNDHRLNTGSQQQSLSVQKFGPQRLSPLLELSTTTTTIFNSDYDLETPEEEVDYSGDCGEAQLLDEQLTSNRNTDQFHANPKDILNALTQDNRNQQNLTSSGRREDNLPGTSSFKNRGTGFQKKQQSGPPIFLDTGEADGRQVPPSGPSHAPIFPKSLNQDGQPIDKVSAPPATLTPLLEQGDESLPPEVPSTGTCLGEENPTSTSHIMQDLPGTSLPKTQHPHVLSGELSNVNPVDDAGTSPSLPHLEADGPPRDDPDFGQCPAQGGQAPPQQVLQHVARPVNGQRIGQRHQYCGREVDVQTGQVVQRDEDRINRTFESPEGYYGLLFHHCFFCRMPYPLSQVPTNALVCDNCGRFFCPNDARRHICVQRWFLNGEPVVNRDDQDDDDDAGHNASFDQQNGNGDDQGAAGNASADLPARNDAQQEADGNATMEQPDEEEQQEVASNLTVNSEDQEAFSDSDTDDDDAEGPCHWCHRRSSAM